MFCRNCGLTLPAGSGRCISCGADNNTDGESRFCVGCGESLLLDSGICGNCGIVTGEEISFKPRNRLTAGLLGVFLGMFGVHSFYLGYKIKGIIQIAATLFTFGTAALWGIIEGIFILSGVINTDSKGNPLIFR